MASASYPKTLDWLFAKLPMYQRVGGAAYKKDLTNTLLLAKHLGNPQNHFKSIHVAGTNGKGSVSHMLASILQEAGYKVGLYTSPHLKDFRERIKINGIPIPKSTVVSFVENNKSFFEANALSFFEMTVGMAFVYFKEQQVDVAIIEVGMGGRLDSTNIICPELAVITNIALDHTAFLGNSLEAIAKEKAGVIKPKTPVVIGETQPENQVVFKDTAAQEQAPIFFADTMEYSDYPLDLHGDYQQHNSKTVQAAIAVLQQNKQFTVPNYAINKGLAAVVANTGLQGRWQELQKQPRVLCDTAHNVSGLRYVTQQLKKESFGELHIVLGTVADKDLDGILSLFPKNARYYFCKPEIPRGLEADILQKEAKKVGLEGAVYRSVNKAYNKALRQANAEDLIFVGGSTFVVAEII